MKKSHIIALLVIAASVAAILSTIADSSTYATFTQAIKKEGKELHVVGKLNKEKERIYNPHVNANLFTFYMFDSEGKEKKVLLNSAPPQDFEKSEQIVVIGKMKGDEFYASSILMKCPSKYNNPDDAAGAIKAS